MKMVDTTSIVTTVEWNKNGETGYKITTRNGSIVSESLVYSRRYAIEAACREATRALINDPVELQKDDPQCILQLRDDALTRVHPRLGVTDISQIRESIRSLGKLVKEHVCTGPSDDEFLLSLGKRRNWKQECAICLTENIMGTTCTCGHTEIAIFRPCGHSVCTQPCFREMMQHSDNVIKPQYITLDGKKFQIMGTIDVSDVSGMRCHACRADIVSTFQAQDCRLGPSLTELCKQFASTL